MGRNEGGAAGREPPQSAPPTYGEAMSDGDGRRAPPPGFSAQPGPGYNDAAYGPPGGAAYNQYGFRPPSPSGGSQPYGPASPPPGSVPAGPTVIVTGGLGSESSRMTCPHCRSEIFTSIRKTPSTMAWVAAGMLFLFVCWPCCWIPLCMDDCKNTEHNCPNCGAYLGRYQT